MTNSIHQDRQGPIWSLGNIAVATPGTPVNIMSLVDPSSVNAPETATPGTVGANEYTNRAFTIAFQPFKAGSGAKLAANTGIVYIVKKALAGAGGTTDTGTIIAALRSTDAPFILPYNANVRDSYNLYEFYIDSDTAADGCQVTAYIA